jgi:AraC-like DNA-binding protein
MSNFLTIGIASACAYTGFKQKRKRVAGYAKTRLVVLPRFCLMEMGMSHVKDFKFSTSAVDSRQKLDAWRYALCEAFGPIDAHRVADQNFEGSFRTYKRVQLQFNEIYYRGQTVERTEKNLAACSQPYFTFGRTLAGPLHVVQGGRNVVIEPGSLILANQYAPYKATANGNYHSVSISIPQKMLLQRQPRIGTFYSLPLNDNAPSGQLLASFTKHLSDGMLEWSDAVAMTLREQLLDLIILLMVNKNQEVPFGSETSLKVAHRERALSYLKCHHRDPSLGPKTIAAACGISINYLHKVFRDANMHVVDLIYAQRLETSKNLLSDPSNNNMTVQQIAYKSGFSHTSHFSRMFKEKFGMPPTAFRSSEIGIQDFSMLGAAD